MRIIANKYLTDRETYAILTTEAMQLLKQIYIDIIDVHLDYFSKTNVDR